MTARATIHEFISPGGHPLLAYAREDTSDLSTLASTLTLWGKSEDEYELGTLRPLTGWALDIGAHIGSVTLALLADHPGLRVVAVEPLAENADLIRESLALNGWTDRAVVIEAAISNRKKVKVAYDFAGDAFARAHRFIGNMQYGVEGVHKDAVVPGVTLTALMAEYRPVEFAKFDCESCEWLAFADKAVRDIPILIAEGHGHRYYEKAEQFLGKSHDLRPIDARDGIGTFRATLKGCGCGS